MMGCGLPRGLWKEDVYEHTQAHTCHTYVSVPFNPRYQYTQRTHSTQSRCNQRDDNQYYRVTNLPPPEAFVDPLNPTRSHLRHHTSVSLFHTPPPPTPPDPTNGDVRRVARLHAYRLYFISPLFSFQTLVQSAFAGEAGESGPRGVHTGNADVETTRPPPPTPARTPPRCFPAEQSRAALSMSAKYCSRLWAISSPANPVSTALATPPRKLLRPPTLSPQRTLDCSLGRDQGGCNEHFQPRPVPPPRCGGSVRNFLAHNFPASSVQSEL